MRSAGGQSDSWTNQRGLGGYESGGDTRSCGMAGDRWGQLWDDWGQMGTAVGRLGTGCIFPLLLDCPPFSNVVLVVGNITLNH